MAKPSGTVVKTDGDVTGTMIETAGDAAGTVVESAGIVLLFDWDTRVGAFDYIYAGEGEEEGYLDVLH